MVVPRGPSKLPRSLLACGPRGFCSVSRRPRSCPVDPERPLLASHGPAQHPLSAGQVPVSQDVGHTTRLPAQPRGV